MYGVGRGTVFVPSRKIARMVLVGGILGEVNAPLKLLAWSPCPFACLAPPGGFEAFASTSDTRVEPSLSLFSFTENRVRVFDPLSPARKVWYLLEC